VPVPREARGGGLIGGNGLSIHVHRSQRG
jgi:hypothetical protein